MVSNSLPYEPRWVAKLLRRDVHDLKVKLIEKVKALIHSSRRSKSTSAHVDVVIAKPESFQSIESTGSAACNLVPGTLYELLEDDLKIVYAARDRDMSHEDRWLFRGSWLVLWSALQACPSNACYDIFGGPKKPMTMLDILEHKFAITFSSSFQISKMPAAPYEGGNDRIRIDSATGADPPSEHATCKPTALKLWYRMLEAATDVSKVTPVAESLLVYACPEKNAVEVIETIGNPGKQSHNHDELRLRFQDLLFPSLNYPHRNDKLL